jgi:hypothetical protein
MSAAPESLCIIAAVFYASAISPALVVRKTMVYGVTIASLLFAFASVEAFLAERLVDWLDVTDHFGPFVTTSSGRAS